MYAIRIEGLTKSYRAVKVLDNLNVEVNTGELVLLTGKNGSGKSTFIKCLLNLVKKDGEITCGLMRFAYCPEKVILPDYISVYDFLYLLGRVRRINEDVLNARLGHYLKLFRLMNHQDKSVLSLSQGTRQKLLLIQTLMAEADVYIFDEPLNGLDSESRRIFVSEVKRLLKYQKTVIIATHHPGTYRMPEKRVICFDKGEAHA
jgi:ABC-type multidrug transport system ATPase subunit